VIDLHSHVLPGVDDGAATLDESVAIARAAAADGVRVLAATPHVREDYPTDAGTMERLVGELRGALARDGVELQVVTGGELALDFLARVPGDELARFGLGGSKTLLLETPYYGWPLDLGETTLRLRARGFRCVLAHPERNGDVQEDPERRLRPLVDSGVLMQVTAASLDGRLGRRTQACVRGLIEAGLAHLLASDAHTPAIRAAGMRAAADAVGDAELARWLSESVPAAILADEPLPERPTARPRRSLLRWRR
jgi:protein-tyrosine phosphatase